MQRAKLEFVELGDVPTAAPASFYTPTATKPAVCAKPNKVVALLGTVLALAIIITVFCLTDFFLYLYKVDGSVRCGDGNVCTLDKLVGGLYCEYPFYPNDHACDSDCYVDGTSKFCDGVGHCTGPYTACKGFCEADSIWDSEACDDTHFKLKPYFAAPGDLHDLADMTGDSYCFANQCIHITMMVQFQTDIESGSWWDSFAGAHVTCADLLDTRSTTFDASCIEATTIDVDSGFICEYFTSNLEDQALYTARA